MSATTWLTIAGISWMVSSVAFWVCSALGIVDWLLGKLEPSTEVEREDL
ncbi:MAG: hypothetical protein MUP90_12685 [Gammaproteobacteria bacterium]|nr:hypothetical protein [Gammaproteobacteria bacterium]